MIKCDEARDLISDWMDGELDADNVARLSKHLFSCEECRIYNRALSQNRSEVFRDMEPVAVPSDLWDGVREQIENSEKIIHMAPARKVVRFWMLAGAAAAMLMVVVLSDFGAGNKGAGSGPVEISSSQTGELFASLYSVDVQENDSYDFGTAVETLLL